MRFTNGTLSITILLYLIAGALSFEAFGQTEVRNRIFEEFLTSLEENNPEQKQVLNIEVVTDLKHAYEQNIISDVQRGGFYKHLLNKTDVRVWPSALKAILLFRLIQYDRENAMPAYRIAESGREPFFNIINDIILSEFAFVEEWKKAKSAEIGVESISSSNIELTEEQRAEVINMAFEKLKKAGINITDYVF
jgi:uncharacterized protein YwgA